MAENKKALSHRTPSAGYKLHIGKRANQGLKSERFAIQLSSPQSEKRMLKQNPRELESNAKPWSHVRETGFKRRSKQF